jgi:hypothetical protein
VEPLQAALIGEELEVILFFQQLLHLAVAAAEQEMVQVLQTEDQVVAPEQAAVVLQYLVEAP